MQFKGSACHGGEDGGVQADNGVGYILIRRQQKVDCGAGLYIEHKKPPNLLP